MEATNIQRILTVKEVQLNMGISKDRAYKLIKMKGFPKIEIGHRYYIPEDAYNAWISNHTKKKVLL